MDGVSDSFKFIQKIWKLNDDILNKKDSNDNSNDNIFKKSINKMVFNITKNLENFQYNVVIANLHETYNLVNQSVINNKTSNNVLKKSWEKIIMILMPIVPHLANELAEKHGVDSYWPKYDESLLQELDCTVIIQVDGRKRGSIQIPINLEKNNIIEKAKNVANVQKYIKKTKIIKNIYLENKLINFITKK